MQFHLFPGIGMAVVTRKALGHIRLRAARSARRLTLALGLVVTCCVAIAGSTPATTIGSPNTLSAPPDVTGPPADAHTTAVGVAMRVLKTGQGIEKPQDNDCVQVHFTVWKRDGTMLSSSRLRGTAEVQCFRSIAPGVATALQAMVVGEERRIWVPRHLTLTPWAEDEAPPPVDVTLDIELIAIIKAPPTPTDLQPAPETVEKTTSGLAFRILQNGTGNQHPAPTSRVTLHLSGWTTKGDLFVSTVRSGRPAVYMVAHLIPGLREGVLHMVMGEKRRFWIPAALAYGEKSRRRGAPAGDLVYDVELLAAE
jgi:FKBP-type peptidyl-prolyl cis-trans isomerase